jgi:hypothetical protein
MLASPAIQWRYQIRRLHLKMASGYKVLMPHFCMSYGDARRLVGVLIMEAPTLIQARMNAAVRGVDAGAPFTKGHHLSPNLMASVPPTQIGRMMSGAEATQLIHRLDARRRPGK